MKRSITLYFLVAIICAFGMTACSNNTDTSNQTLEISPQQLQEVNFNCIDIETPNIVMENDIEGTVEITVQIPDYEALYKQAHEFEDPDVYILQALESGKYDSCERIIMARVTVENGEQVVHTDEALKELLERELSNAINALMEEQGC